VEIERSLSTVNGLLRKAKPDGQGVFSMSDEQIHAKAVIAAAIIQSRGVDVEGLASNNKDISGRKLAHLRELTERIYNALSGQPES
jgi:hypothetical protein